MRVVAVLAVTILLSLLSGIAAATEPVPAGSDPAVRQWPHWPYQSVCYGPPFDPVTVFSGPAVAEFGSTSAETALRETIRSKVPLPLPENGWRLASESESNGVFVNGRLSSPYPIWASFERDAQGWKLIGTGSCTPQTVIQGLVAVTWELAEGQSLGKNARRMLVDLGSGPCDGGASQNARARKPVFRQLGKRLLMTMTLKPVSPGVHICPGVTEPPLTVALPGRLGRRELFDGGTYPPRPAVVAQPARSSRLRQ